MKDSLEKIIIQVLKKHGAKKVELFGSYAKGKESKKSDIDLIVEFKDKKSLVELIKIEQELENLVKRKVDLLTPSAIHPLLRKKIESEKKVLLNE